MPDEYRESFKETFVLQFNWVVNGDSFGTARTFVMRYGLDDFNGIGERDGTVCCELTRCTHDFCTSRIWVIICKGDGTDQIVKHNQAMKGQKSGNSVATAAIRRVSKTSELDSNCVFTVVAML